MKNKYFRAKARGDLGGGIFQRAWLYGLLVYLIATALLGAASMVAIGALLVTGPLMYGVNKYFLSRTRGGDEKNLGGIFDGFTTDFGGTMLLGLMQSIFTLLWTLLFIVPGIIKTYSYSMSYFIKVDHPEYDWNQCITESRRLMKGHKWQLFCLDFSFFGWMILGTLCCCVGVLWVYPYMYAARANFYEAIKPVTAEDMAADESIDPNEPAKEINRDDFEESKTQRI